MSQKPAAISFKNKTFARVDYPVVDFLETFGLRGKCKEFISIMDCFNTLKNTWKQHGESQKNKSSDEANSK